MSEIRYRVEGMTCGGCERALVKAIQQAHPEWHAEAAYAKDELHVRGEHDVDELKRITEDAGFEFVGPVAA